MAKQDKRGRSARHEGRISPVMGLIVGLVLLAAVGGAVYLLRSPAPSKAASESGPVLATRTGVDELQMAPEQVTELQVGEVKTQRFEQQREAIGIIDLNQDNAVQVFSPYQGRIGQIGVKAGDDVSKGQVLYTVQIPDLAQAASALISASGNLRVATETLRRAQALAEAQSIPQKELQQNQADQQTADAAYRAARCRAGSPRAPAPRASWCSLATTPPRWPWPTCSNCGWWPACPSPSCRPIRRGRTSPCASRPTPTRASAARSATSAMWPTPPPTASPCGPTWPIRSTCSRPRCWPTL